MLYSAASCQETLTECRPQSNYCLLQYWDRMTAQIDLLPTYSLPLIQHFICLLTLDPEPITYDLCSDQTPDRDRSECRHKSGVAKMMCRVYRPHTLHRQKSLRHQQPCWLPISLDFSMFAGRGGWHLRSWTREPAWLHQWPV